MSTRIYPSEEECIRLLEEAGCKRRVIVHCCTVCTMAEAFAERIDCDRALLRAGALLHDIGRSVTHSIEHALIGYGIVVSHQTIVADHIVCMRNYLLLYGPRVNKFCHRL